MLSVFSCIRSYPTDQSLLNHPNIEQILYYNATLVACTVMPSSKEHGPHFKKNLTTYRNRISYLFTLHELHLQFAVRLFLK